MPVVRNLITKLGYEYDSSKLADATKALQKYKNILDSVAKAEVRAESSTNGNSGKLSRFEKASGFKRLAEGRITAEKTATRVVNKMRADARARAMIGIDLIKQALVSKEIRHRIENAKTASLMAQNAKRASSAWKQAGADMMLAQKRRIDQSVANIKKEKAQVLQLLRMYQSIGRSVRNATLMFGFGVGRPIMGFLSDTIKVSAEFESMQTTFAVLLKDVGKAKNLMSDMETLAQKTPLDIKGIAKVGKILLGTGMGTDDVMKRIHQLGEVTGGKKDVFERVAWQYAQSVAKGRPQGDELRRFGEAGIPIEAELAKNLGTTQKNIREMSKQGKLSIDHLNDALDSLTKKGGLFYGLMAEKLKTLEGQTGRYLSLVTKLKRVIGDDWKWMFTQVLKVVNFILELLLKMPRTLRWALVLFTAMSVVGVGMVSVMALLASSAFAVAMAFKTAKSEMMQTLVAGGLLEKKVRKMGMMQMVGQLAGGKLGKAVGKGGLGGKLAGAGLKGLAGAGALKLGARSLLKFIPYVGAILFGIEALMFFGKKMSAKNKTDQGTSLSRRGTGRSVNVNVTNSNMVVPQGTTKQQEESYAKTAKRIFNREVVSLIAGATADTAGVA